MAQGGSKIRTSQDFKWSKPGQLPNGPDLYTFEIQDPYHLKSDRNNHLILDVKLLGLMALATVPRLQKVQISKGPNSDLELT